MSKIRGVILLDGADCTGKTTLAGNIAKRATDLGAQPIICHLGKPAPGTCWEEHKTALCDYLDKAFRLDMLVIADRHFLSEAVYGCSYRTGSEYPYAARHVDRLLHRFRALRVICAPPVGFVVENHAKMKQVRREEYDSGMDIVAQRYLDLWHGAKSGHVTHGTSTHLWHYNSHEDYIQQLTRAGGVADKLGWYHYDVTTQGENNSQYYVDYLLDELQTEQEVISEYLLAPDLRRFTGYPTPQSVLLVGDRIKSENPLHVPFLSNSNSSVYLAETLHKLHADESRVVIANVHDKGGTETIKDLNAYCGRTIVMGREAEKTLLNMRLSFDARVRHPQHARRFSHNDDSYEREMRIAFHGMAGVFPWRAA